MRTHVVLPEELVREVDACAGKRGRSRFIEEAVRERLRRERLAQALRETAGIFKDLDVPEWATPEKVSEWVRENRRTDDEHRRQKLARPRHGELPT